MAAVRILLTILAACAAIAAVRGAPAATSRPGRRMAAIAGLLVAQLVVLGVFLGITVATGWGTRHANPPGLAFAAQALRLALAFAAAAGWVGLVRDDLRSGRQRLLVAIGWVALGWGSGLGPLAAIV